MTRALAEMMERIKTWPADRRDDAAKLLERMEGSGTSVYRLSAEEKEWVREGLDSEVMSDADVAAFRAS